MQKRGFKKEDFANFHPGGSLGKRLFLKVKDVMRSENLPIVRWNASLKSAIDTMTHGKLGTVLIVDKDGVLDALLSDGDLRRALMREVTDAAVNEIFYRTLFTLGEDFAEEDLLQIAYGLDFLRTGGETCGAER